MSYSLSLGILSKERRWNQITHFIKFKRIIYDQIHELYTYDTKVLYHINYLYSNFTWGITGIPDYNNNQLNSQSHTLNEKYILHLYLLFQNDFHYDIYNNKYNFFKHFLKTTKKYNNLLYNKYLEISRQNKIEDIEDEIKLPGINNIIEFLEFSQEEREIYESESIEASELDLNVETILLRRRQLCCHPMLIDSFKFNEESTITKIKDKITEFGKYLLMLVPLFLLIEWLLYYKKVRAGTA